MASTTRIEWGGQLDEMAHRLGVMRTALTQAVTELLQAYGQQIQASAQDGAPWTDRTSNARQGLRTAVEGGPEQFALVLYHTATYGIWLEVRWGGRWSIIMKTLEAEFPGLMSALSMLVR